MVTPVAADPAPVRAGAEPLLRVSGLTVRFGALHVLEGVELTVGRGELVAVAGENGAGKSTLVRCVVGDLAPTSGTVIVAGHRVSAGRMSLRHPGIGVVWQEPAQCDNLDVTSNLMLGRERRWTMQSDHRRHRAAAALLAELGIGVIDTMRPMQSLSRSQQQLVAIARAVRDRPELLVLDEPTGALGVSESGLVEQLIARLHAGGSTIVLVSHDVPQMMRLADRIAVLRHGLVVGEVDPVRSHPDDVAALVAGQQVESSARRQLVRLQGLVDQLASSDAASGLPLILSALGAALGVDRLCVHLTDRGRLRLAGALGLPGWQRELLADIPPGAAGGPTGVAAQTGRPVVDHDGSLRRAAGWPVRPDGERARNCFAAPVLGASEVLGVITMFRFEPGAPGRDELDLIGLYAGYAAGAVERDRLLGQVTARNRVLETIRVALQALTGAAALDSGLRLALEALQTGTGARSVGLFTRDGDGAVTCLARVGGDGDGDPGLDARLDTDGAGDGDASPPAVGPPVVGPDASPGAARPSATEIAAAELDSARLAETAHSGRGFRAVTFAAPQGPAVLLARWAAGTDPPEDRGLLVDAAQCLRLAFERQEAESARQRAAALQRSQFLQRQFLSRLSHELRTPLTAIRGYASSLTQPDVTWDAGSQHRFVNRISAESDRLGRLVGDLLDFSAIESGVLRLHRDWCELPLVLDAARSCLPPESAGRVSCSYEPGLPVVWADHDRLEQVFVNLMDNAVRHNPPGTSVIVQARRGPGGVCVTVTDDGGGLPAGTVGTVVPPGHHTPSSGSGLGLSITRGIIAAHHGTIVAQPVATGTSLRVELPEDDRRDDVAESTDAGAVEVIA